MKRKRRLGQPPPDVRQDRDRLHEPSRPAQERPVEARGEHALLRSRDLQLARRCAYRRGPGGRPMHENAVLERHSAEPNLFRSHTRSLPSLVTVTNTHASPLSHSTRTGLALLAAALLLGALGNALLRQTPWGLNVAVWVLALAAAGALLLRPRPPPPPPGPPWAAAPGSGFSVAAAPRGSPTL